jgi:Cu-processing system ATP-binding protein
MNTIIDYKNVCFSYGEQQILFDICLKIQKGESVAIVGHNGAGKTTLIKLLIGVMSPSSGVVNSIKYAQTSKLSFMPEHNALYNHLTGIESMNYYAGLKKADKSSIMGILNLVNIDFAANKKISDYSKGMKQRLMLAQALLSKPEILILDEPYSGLDPNSRRLFSQIFKQLQDQGKSVIFSSHTLDGLKDVASNVIFIDKGRVALSGNINTIMQDLNLDSKIEIKLLANTNIDLIINPIKSLVSSHTIDNNRVTLFYKEKHNIKLLKSITSHPQVIDIDITKANVNNIYHHIYNK